MINNMPPWMWLTWLIPSALALIFGLYGLKRWRKPALFLIGNAVSAACVIFGQFWFAETAATLQKMFDLSVSTSYDWATILYVPAGYLPPLLMLCAIFSDRPPPPSKSASPPSENL